MRLEKYEGEMRKTNEASLIRKMMGGLEKDEGVRQVLELLKMARRSADYVWWEASKCSRSWNNLSII